MVSSACFDDASLPFWGPWWVGVNGCARWWPAVRPPGIEHITTNRKVDISYRSTLLKQVDVSTAYAEAELRIWAVIKAEAVRLTLLDPLGAELSLDIHDPVAVFKFGISAEVLAQVSWGRGNNSQHPHGNHGF